MSPEEKEIAYTARWAILNDRPELALLELGKLLETPPAAPDEVEIPLDGRFRVVLVVGHNERAQGAVATGALEGLTEYDLNTATADYLCDQLSDERIEFIKVHRRDRGSYTREIDEAYQLAASYEPDLILEMHFNAGGGSYACSLAAQSSPGSQAIGHIFAETFASGIAGASNAGVQLGGPSARGFRGLHATPYPSILLEPFFGDHSGHCAAIRELRVNGLAALYRRGCERAAALIS